MGRSSVPRSGFRYCSAVLMLLWPIIACTVRRSGSFLSSAPRIMSVAKVWCNELHRHAAYGVSKITTTTPTAMTNSRKHLITTSGAPETTLKSFTAEGVMKNNYMNRFPGVFVDSFNFSVNRGSNQFASLTSSCYGCGTFTNTTETNSDDHDHQTDSTPKIGCNVCLFSYVIGDV